MMKRTLLILFASSSLLAFGAPAYAQTSDPVVSNPNTTQTDRSEEDWRKSKKKSSTDDILDIFTNPNSTGVGNTRTYKPIEALPETSRRHLMRERAKRMAEAGVGEPIPTHYEPSAAAKSDAALKADEQAAWDDIVKDMNGGVGGNGGGQGSDTQAGQQDGTGNGAGQSGNGQNPSTGRAGGGSDNTNSDGQDGSQSRSPSTMRGGSAVSVSDILNRIKGRGPSEQGTPDGVGNSPTTVKAAGQGGPQSPAQGGNSSAGTASMGNGQAQADGQDQGQAQSEAQSAADSASSTADASQDSAQSVAAAQASADGQDAEAAADAQEAQAAANAQAAAEADAAAQAKIQRTPEPMSPLDRLKQNRDSGDNSGSRSSASDFLKKKD